MRRGLIAGVLLCASAGWGQTTSTNCTSIPIGSLTRTSCRSTTYDPWPAIQEQRRIWENFGRDMQRLGTDIQQQMMMRKLARLEEEISKKQAAENVRVATENARITTAVQAQCKQAFLGVASAPKLEVYTAQPGFEWFRDSCIKLNYWHAPVKEVAEALSKADYFKGMCQVSFQHEQYHRQPRGPSASTNVWDTFPKALLVKQEVCQPWGLWNAGE